MNQKPNSMSVQNRRMLGLAQGISRSGTLAATVLMISIGVSISTAQTEVPQTEDQREQVLTRGPVHEAFADVVAYNPEPGIIVEKAPPEMIEEIPPDIRPEGDNISWIPGYWGWDDETNDYLWISGTWRAVPPERQWTSGYWHSTGQGHQWISGYWADASARETSYLPKPPATVEAGPNVNAPSGNHVWIPGSWVWGLDRYEWRPGYWLKGRSAWEWIPAHYVWTPRGYVLVDGYWDYNLQQRGVLYAPVHLQQGYYSRPGYSYSPVIAIGLVAMMEHLFLRPRYHHYYFGDYYERRYRDSGYYPPYAFHSSRQGYDPVYSHLRWTQRQDRDWERRQEASYVYRRDHETARPPRTWAAQMRLNQQTPDATQHRLLLASPLDRMAKQKDSQVRIRRVAAKERQRFAATAINVRKAQQQRRAIETEGRTIADGKAGQNIKPTRARLPASPVVGKPAARPLKKPPPPRPKSASPAKTKREPPHTKPDTGKPATRKEQTPPARKAVIEGKNLQPKPKSPPDNFSRGKTSSKNTKSERKASEGSGATTRDGPVKAGRNPKPPVPRTHQRVTGKPSAGTRPGTAPTKKSGAATEESEPPAGKNPKKERK